MNLRSKVDNLLRVELDKNPSLFLIKLTVGIDNSIRVILDGDKGISLKDCISISRAIEQQLDRESEDFSLEVASAGVGSTLQNERQYYKNIGRKLEVEISEGTQFSGILSAVSKNGFSIEWKQREPKKIGKGKETVFKNKTLSFSEITQSNVILQF